MTEQERKDGKNERNRAWKAANREKVKAAARARRAANPEKVRAADRSWRAANPEKVRAAARAWRAANPEKVRAAARAWRAANPEKVRARNRAWKAANREKVRARIGAWRAANREKVRATKHRRRERILANIRAIEGTSSEHRATLARAIVKPRPVRLSTRTPSVRSVIAWRYRHGWNGRCDICNRPVRIDAKGNAAPSVDHVLPVSKGGSNSMLNLRPVHLRCNCSKGNRAVGQQLALPVYA